LQEARFCNVGDCNCNALSPLMVSFILSLSKGEPRTAALPSGKSAAFEGTPIKPPDKNNRGCLSTPLKPELSYPRPFHGELLPEPFESGEGRRVSGRATDPSAGRPVRLRRSICAYRQILPPLLTPTPIVRTLHRRRRWARTPGVHPLALRNKQKLAGRGTTLAGGLRIALFIYKDALRRPPVFPQCKQWPDSG
jgi:hypothetical protein